MKLGAFSVSLAVKDLQKSLDFYQTLGFVQFAGEAEQGWVIVKNEATTIGLFQGMFEDNILTFNPGWDQNCQKQNDFMDVREIEQNLLKAGLNVVSNTKETKSGAAHIILEDPDGNKLMLDQHV